MNNNINNDFLNMYDFMQKIKNDLYKIEYNMKTNFITMYKSQMLLKQYTLTASVMYKIKNGERYVYVHNIHEMIVMATNLAQARYKVKKQIKDLIKNEIFVIHPQWYKARNTKIKTKDYDISMMSCDFRHTLVSIKMPDGMLSYYFDLDTDESLAEYKLKRDISELLYG